MTPPELAEGVLAGKRRALAKAITAIENDTPAAPAILSALYPRTGQAQVIGITGAPGTGKSTLVDALVEGYRAQAVRVAVVAVDPSSPFTNGAVLGDRIRMERHTGDQGVFIRSMASRGNLGGIAATTADVVRVLDAADFGVILIETVGAGQNDVAVAQLAQTVIVVEAPGMGDDIQASKAGILETADLMIVNKADRPGAEKTAQTLRAMLDLGKSTAMRGHHGMGAFQAQPQASEPIARWSVPVLKTMALAGEGIAEVIQAITDHQLYLRTSGEGQRRTRQRLEAEVMRRLQAHLLQKALEQTPPALQEALLQDALAHHKTPADVVQQWLDQL